MLRKLLQTVSKEIYAKNHLSINDSTLKEISVCLNCDLLSYQTKELCQTVFLVILSGPLSLFGIGANIINIIVFVRQGFKETINTSLLGLAVADLGCALTMLWMSVCFNPLFASADLNFSLFAVVYITAGMPYAYFNRVTSFITAFITLERCLCVTIPLKVKEILTPLTTKIIIIAIFISILAVFSPFFFVNYLDQVYIEELNRTILSLVLSENRIFVETIIYFIHSIIFPVVSFVFVILSTILLTTVLNKKQKWRQAFVASSSTKQQLTSFREKRVIKMVTLISVIFIICYSPGTVNFVFTVFYPDFSYTGRYSNTFMVIWSATVLLQNITFSLNTFVYMTMSSKFKETLMKLVVRRTFLNLDK